VGGRSTFFFACLFFPVSLSARPLPFPFLPSLKTRPLKIQPGPKASSGPYSKSNLVHFSIKIWHLMATILMIFLKIKLPNFVEFTVTRYWGKSKPRVVSFKARFFTNHYYEYKQFRHWYIKGEKVSCKIWPLTVSQLLLLTFLLCCLSVLAVQTKTSKFGIRKAYWN